MKEYEVCATIRFTVSAEDERTAHVLSWYRLEDIMLDTNYVDNVQVSLKKGEQTMEKKEFWVFGGMHDPFGGYHYLGNVWGSAPDDPEVMDDAHELCVGIYESYAGLHGIRSWDDIFNDLFESESTFSDDVEISDEDVNDVYNEEIDGWCCYWIMEAIPGENPEEEKWLEIAMKGEIRNAQHYSEF